jgi:hypothetical protein
VITALTEEQAWNRAGGAVGNRGEEAAAAAVEMARLIGTVRGAARGKTSGTRKRSGRRARTGRPAR